MPVQLRCTDWLQSERTDSSVYFIWVQFISFHFSSFRSLRTRL